MAEDLSAWLLEWLVDLLREGARASAAQWREFVNVSKSLIRLRAGRQLDATVRKYKAGTEYQTSSITCRYCTMPPRSQGTRKFHRLLHCLRPGKLITFSGFEEILSNRYQVLDFAFAQRRPLRRAGAHASASAVADNEFRLFTALEAL